MTQRHAFTSHGGILSLFWPNEWDSSKRDVTDIIKSFYEANPFPNYDGIETVATLHERANKSLFARWLDEQIPPRAKILEVGCGTGQLSNFLSTTWGRTVFGTDLSLSSLALGHQFREVNQLLNVAFLQMNLFRPAFRPEVFDVVICNGVLHHTSDPLGGFRSIAKLVKVDGFIIIGLYNKYGRISTRVRRILINLTGYRLKFLDSRLRDRDLPEHRKRIWFMDQYRNPHESTHTIAEVLHWFDQTGFAFISAVPKLAPVVPLSSDEKLFSQSSRGSRTDHLLVQLEMLLQGGKDGGLFVMIGQKKGS